jgi:hypothetical protein
MENNKLTNKTNKYIEFRSGLTNRETQTNTHTTTTTTTTTTFASSTFSGIMTRASIEISSWDAMIVTTLIKASVNS